ncbi:MAG: phospholipase A [Parahaliea sp.]
MLLVDVALAANTPFEACLLAGLATGDPATTIEQLRAACEQADSQLSSVAVAADKSGSSDNTIARRMDIELESRKRGYTMTAHNPNYILPFTHNTEPNEAPFLKLDSEAEVDENEAMIQVSVKFPVAIDLWDSNTDLMVAYTNRAWWQVYNDEFSKPFRETNYLPELFLRHYNLEEKPKWYEPQMLDFGYIHQSNGRDEPLSRSWDRLLASAYFQLNPNLALALRTWYRLPENDDDDELAGEYRYLGYGDARAVYTHNKHTLSMMVRPGTEETSFEATWSYPIVNHIRLMLYYFNGYGESLLDYDAKSERFGIGFAINDYLVN